MSDLDTTVWCNRILFNKDNFNIALFKDTRTNVTYTIKGDMSVSVGGRYKIRASLDGNPKYPDTYKMESCRYDIDLTTSTPKQLEKFFSTILGKGIAKELSNTPNIIDMLEKDDKDSLLSIKGVGEPTYEVITQAYVEQKDMSMAYIYFKDYEFTKSMIDTICYHYRSPDRAIEIAKKNPYLLVNVPKLGFKKVDSAVLLMNKNTNTQINHKQRFIAYIDFLFDEEYANGNTWLSPKELIDKVVDFVPGVEIKDVIEYINDSDKFYSIDNENSQFGRLGKRITNKRNLILEMKIAKELRRISIDKSRLYIKDVDKVIKDTETRQGWEYADEQKRAINTILNNNVCIIQGTAGSGKTSTVNAYTNILKHNNYMFSQCALSGKAANNLTIATGVRGSTIHSLIGYNTKNQNNKKHPLPTDVVILDEISMVEDRIFLALLEAIPKGGKLIMLGDAGQLDSIGVGVLNGMIRSKAIPTITLKQIHRQATKSAIITHSLEFRKGKLPQELKLKTFSEKIYGEKQDLKYILVKKDEEDEISRLAMFEYKRLIAEYGVDNVSIICSTKKTGTTSTQKLNAYAQIIANPEKINKKEIKIGKNNNLYVLREGDKVINSKNNYNTKNVYGYPTPIYNGNTGTLLSINNDGSLTIDFDGIDKILVEGSSVKNIELGYATTIHRVQGSTIKAVIFALPFHFLLNSRELVYTGATRASDYQTIITSPRSIREALKKTSKREEKTNLDIFIRELNIWQEKLGIRV